MNDKDVIEILFIGDIVGRPGRRIVKDYLEHNSFDFVIANVENASHGFGLTKKNHEDLKSYGVDAMTSGNHIWDKKEVFDYINDSDVLIRPLNYPNCEWGAGYKIFEVNGIKIAVTNLLGRTFMTPVDSPFEVLRSLVEEIKDKVDLIFVDFHAEATAEKVSLGYYAKDLGVNAVLGTHTHIQTADEKILDKKMVYITDAGFCGAAESIIGMDIAASVKRWLTSIHDRLDVCDTKLAQFNGVKFVFNKSDFSCEEVQRISFIKDFSEVIDMKGS